MPKARAAGLTSPALGTSARSLAFAGFASFGGVLTWDAASKLSSSLWLFVGAIGAAWSAGLIGVFARRTVTLRAARATGGVIAAVAGAVATVMLGGALEPGAGTDTSALLFVTSMTALGGWLSAVMCSYRLERAASEQLHAQEALAATRHRELMSAHRRSGRRLRALVGLGVCLTAVCGTRGAFAALSRNARRAAR